MVRPAQPPSPPRPPRAESSGLAARRAALTLIDAALARRGGMEDAPDEDVSGLEPRDRAFARALALATLRHLGPIDHALAARMHKAPPSQIQRLLRLGAAQLLFLNTPPHAAVATTLDLAAPDPSAKPFTKLMNGVLRGLDRERPEVKTEQYAPDWLYARWRAAYGEAGAQAICIRITEEPLTDLSLRGDRFAEPLIAELPAERLTGGSLRTDRRGDVSTWPGFAEGQWWVQDAAAAIPARLLRIEPGQTALDLCAAPGGKTMQLVAMGARVTALDRSGERLARVRENLGRIGLEAETVTADAAAWRDERTFDAVLLDAPCSATGTFRRHPDVLWTARPGDIASLATVQARLLDAAADRTRPGGRLVYCVCSLEPEEGEAQIEAGLKRRSDLALDPVQPGEGGAPAECVAEQGWLRILPSVETPKGGMDGFFIARFRRIA